MLGLSAHQAEGQGQRCSITPGGQVTNFQGENYKVLIPCKYRLVHMTCGDYKVKVTPGNGVGEDRQFSPDTVWVGITTMTRGGRVMWKGRTAQRRLEKADTVDEIWMEKIVNMSLDVETFEKSSKSAVLEMRGVFRIGYSVQGSNIGVFVTCFHKTFKSKPYPLSICGKGLTKRAIESRRLQVLGQDTEANNTMDNIIIHDVLSNPKVKQRKICHYSADIFQACTAQNKVTVARLCGSIYSVPDLAACLVTGQDMMGNFERCMSAVCKGKGCACRKLVNKVKTTCGNQNLVLNFDRLQCRRNE
ncbi:hypothetical protein ACOMHN_060300 [Nucella lapillus]